MGDTRTDPLRFQHHERDANDVRGPQLFKILECDEPLAPSARFCLTELEEVVIGRDRTRAFGRATVRGRRILRVSIPDTWTSSEHSRLLRTDDGWKLEDSRSKNGTYVNGERRERAQLRDGDLFAIGHVFFMYRESGSGLGDESADQLRAPAPELATFVRPLAYQFELMARLAAKPLANLMLLGETGTGKEVVARAFHTLSKRPGPFVAVNCAALPASLFEAELFGYRRGAFSGAFEDRPGLVRAADHGTLFLDEIGDLPPASQVSLLRVLQEREVLPLGATQPVKVDLQIVSATHRDPRRLVENAQFRRDLLARLSGFRVMLPAVAERREDLGILTAALLRRVPRSFPPPRLSTRAAAALLRYDWPLNVRELDACLSTGVALAVDGVLHLRYLPDVVQSALASRPRRVRQDAPRAPEEAALRSRLEALLSEHTGNVARVAEAMGKAPAQIHRWVKRLEVDLRRYRRTRE
jgi:sigma54-dependent transcription regulator